MTNNDFMNLYWKQFLMIEKEFRRSIQYVALSNENFDTYSDFFAKILLQIGSEIDVVAKVLCKEINSGSGASKIDQYCRDLLASHPEIEQVTIKCVDIPLVPWNGWSSASPTWWKIYNGVKHNKSEVETYDGITKENYKFANLKSTVTALAALYLLEIYLYNYVADANPHTDTPVPGSRFFKPIDHGWENKRAYGDTGFQVEGKELIYFEPPYIYSDL